MSEEENASKSAFDRSGRLDSRSNENLASAGNSKRTVTERETGIVRRGRTVTGRRLARAGQATKKGTRLRIALFLALPFIPLGLSTPGWCLEQFQAREPGVSRGEECTAFIETARPGGDVTVPYGKVYRTLTKARKDARHRCRATTLAQEGWGPCRTWCVEVDH